MRSSVWLAASFSLGLAASAGAQQYPQMRFQGMDTNRDGVITRAEWRGNARAFRNQDWNGDGILSGEEVRPGAVRPREREVAGTSGRQDRFTALDVNGDNRLSRSEWRASATVFNALDANGDGVLTRQEAVGAETPAPQAQDDFTRIDVNRDGAIARNEWRWNSDAFDRLDANRDGRVTRNEFDGIAPPQNTPQQNTAWRAGFGRGQQDGIQAGREDRPRGWDLDGQRELETADAGYEGRFGALSDYQAGYRIGFRRGYREGFGIR